MFEKVNPAHPDKLADRIAGAIVDLAYRKEANPKIAVEVLLGHGFCTIIIETSVKIVTRDIFLAVKRIVGKGVIHPKNISFIIEPQDGHLSENQRNGVRCGDNGIFKGMPVTEEQRRLAKIAKEIYAKYPYDGKYILDGERLIICQSNADGEELREAYPNAEINPLGGLDGRL